MLTEKKAAQVTGSLKYGNNQEQLRKKKKKKIKRLELPGIL